MKPWNRFVLIRNTYQDNWTNIQIILFSPFLSKFSTSSQCYIILYRIRLLYSIQKIHYQELCTYIQPNHNNILAIYYICFSQTSDVVKLQFDSSSVVIETFISGMRNHGPVPKCPSTSYFWRKTESIAICPRVSVAEWGWIGIFVLFDPELINGTYRWRLKVFSAP